MKLEILKVYHGDSILIKFEDNNKMIRNILVDGGIKKSYPRVIKRKLKEIINNKEVIDLLVITHIDDDHIGGIIKLFEDEDIDRNIIKKIWFNSEYNISSEFPELEVEPEGIEVNKDISNQTSFVQGNTLEKELKEQNNWEDRIIQFSKEFIEYNIGDAELTVLTPRFDGIIGLQKKWQRELPESKKSSSEDNDYSENIKDLIKIDFKEDESVTNKSSISFLLEHNKEKILLLGDAHPTDVIKSLDELGYTEENKLKVDYVKLSHHGSKKNTNFELLKIISCNKFIISTNGSRHGLPSKECVSKIVSHVKDGDVELYFNYPEIVNSIFTQDEIETYNIKCLDTLDIKGSI